MKIADVGDRQSWGICLGALALLVSLKLQMP
jgi:hypothetical protein